jgi:magnesium transporter
MKVLTVISSIFIPLTFIVGVYGMNFEYMPELHMMAAYPLVWLVMIGLAVGMLGYFWRLGWIGRSHQTTNTRQRR